MQDTCLETSWWYKTEGAREYTFIKGKGKVIAITGLCGLAGG